MGKMVQDMPPRFNEWHDDLIVVLISALIYYFSYLSSYQLSSLYEFSHATSWIYLPSGVRLLLVLILMKHGALGIMFGTLAIDYLHHDHNDHFYNIVTALVAGASAYLSLKLANRSMNLQPDLARLNQRQLLVICIIFAIVSPVMHQAWYFVHGDTEHIWHSVAVMAVGDLGGSVILLGVLYWLRQLVRTFRTP